MKEQILISVDCGKGNTKALAKWKGRTYTTTFPTRIQQVKRFGVEIQPNSYLVEYNGDEFLLGEMKENYLTTASWTLVNSINC